MSGCCERDSACNLRKGEEKNLCAHTRNFFHSTSRSGCTNRPLFPKIHMLHHAAEFVSKHHALGLFSEAPIESFHARFNEKYRDHHYNKGSSKAERIRRSHADLLLESISS